MSRGHPSVAMSSPYSSYSSGSSRSPTSYARTPSRSSMSDSDENLSPCGSPSPSCSLTALLDAYSGARSAPMGRRSVFAESRLAATVGDRSRVVRNLFTADRGYAAEVTELASDEEMDLGDIEFLEEAIDVSDDGTSEDGALEHSVVVRRKELVTKDDDENSFVELGSGSASPSSCNSSLSAIPVTNSHELFGSGGMDLLVSAASYDDGISGFGGSEGMTVEVSPIVFEHDDRDGALPDKLDKPTVIVCEDGGSTHNVQEVPADQGNQGVRIVLKRRGGSDHGARWSVSATGRGGFSGQQDADPNTPGLDGRGEDEPLVAMRAAPIASHAVVAGLDTLNCSVTDQGVLDENVPLDLTLPKIDSSDAVANC